MSERVGRGREPVATNGHEGPDKPLKKKRSIFRSLSRSRRSSKQRPESPEFMTSSEALPAMPNPTSKPRVVSSSSIGPEPESGNLRDWNPYPASRDLDSNNVARNQDQHRASIRDSSSTTNSQKTLNFSRHPRNRSGTVESYDESKPSHRDTLLPPPPEPPTIKEQEASNTRELHHQQSHGSFQRRPDVKDGNVWPGSPMYPWNQRRPQTAIADSQRGREIPNFSSPRVTRIYSHIEAEKIQSSSDLDSQTQNKSSKQDELRDSGISQYSTDSTNPSSTFTKASVISDSNTDMNDQDLGVDEMTVDDAIDLYAGGFEDDHDHTPQLTPTEGTRSSARHTQFFSHINIEARSSQLAQAMNDPLTAGSLPKPMKPKHPTSAAIFGGEIFKSLYPRPPELLQHTATHDQYGFRKSSRDITVAQYDEWYKEYAEMQTRRNSKWVEMMIDAGLSTREPEVFPNRSAKVQRFIRKGVPPAWRGAVWWFYAGGPEVLGKNTELYANLILESQKGKLSEGDKESIERDLHRTFPDNIHFKPENAPGGPNQANEMPLMSALRRVLSAFAIHHPRIGYCQSLNFLAGLLLLFLTGEKSFWMLHIITSRLLPGTHETSLEGANVDLWVLMLALKDALPDIWTKVGGEAQKTPSKLPPISLCTTSWFMSLFIGTLPTETTLRVWDALFYDGSVTIFRMAIGVFRLGEGEIKAVNDQMETFQVVQTLPRKIIDAGSLMSTAYRKNSVATSWVEKKRKERRAWYAEERLAERARKQSKDTEGGPTPDLDSPALTSLSGVATTDDDRVGRPGLSRSKSMGLSFKRSLSMRRAKSAKRSNTVKVKASMV